MPAGWLAVLAEASVATESERECEATRLAPMAPGKAKTSCRRSMLCRSHGPRLGADREDWKSVSQDTGIEVGDLLL